LKSSKKIALGLARWVASGFGSGNVARAPGTFGSVAALLFWWILQAGQGVADVRFQLLLVVSTCVIGVSAAAHVCRYEGAEDHQWIVIDEWAGMFVSLLFVAPTSFVEMLAALTLFRVFDVLKPGPVGLAERLPGGWGIMADDLVAGVLACSVLRAVM
jgi:phosphatidylglycerophosphatase A